MRCWVVEAITDEGRMVLAECPDPVPGPGELVVRVEAAGVNFADTLMVRGRYQRKPALPFVPGIEVSGEVVAAGPGCARVPGDRVCASVPTGGFAELALVPDAAATVIPAGVPSDAGLVLLGVNYPTAWYALHRRAAIRPGETVLVHAAAGGVGSASVQIALAAGCRVIATAGSPAKLDVCRRLGAEVAVSYADPGWVEAIRAATGGAGADVIVDPVGGRVGVDSLRALTWHGRLLVVGFAGGAAPELPANRLLLKEGTVLGVFWGEVKNRDPGLLREVQDAILALHAEARLDPLIGARLPLEDAPAALAQLAGRQSVGKLLLTPRRRDRRTP
ncbi:NADPH2:quinone reductase [Methylobacterium sp. ap11]|uniref:NADPH:quinone oxidoreductase family protein n=1 Tax=Methylobacterium sp. ap11 TaxID=1761799 RepID=UPI0008C4A087|nr:NADPH:quinone oxidoreductase family protein [Methylobacterium sp. ap11]SEP28809.1 NADPH2:quinone reductase [Methylobacterium sp. ap11]